MTMPLSLLAAARDPILVRALYQPLQNHPDLFLPNLQSVAPSSGAIGRNAAWETGTGEKWFIEQQRYGLELVQAGIVLGNDALVQKGCRGLAWGWQKQDKSDGSFPGTGDAFHSVSIFLEASARALLLLRESGNPNYAAIANEYALQALAAGRWLNRPENSTPVWDVELRYTHRMWILAASLGSTAFLTGDETLAYAASEWAERGLGLQRADGINPEKGGFDVNYQSAGCMLAGRYYSVCQDAALRERVAQMLRRALHWERGKTDANGVVDTTGSLRVGEETGRSGTIKTVNYKEALFAFVHGSQITGVSDFRNVAERIAARSDWLAILASLYPFQPD